MPSSQQQTLILRSLALLGGVAGTFWVLAMVIDAVWQEDRPLILVIVMVGSTAVVWFIGALFLRFSPNALSVRTAILWRRFVLRVLVGAALSYPLMALVLGSAAAGAMHASGIALEGKALLAVWFHALWLPIWYLPMSAAFIASVWNSKSVDMVTGHHQHARWTIWMGAGLALCVMCLSVWSIVQRQHVRERRQRIHELDERVAQDVEQALIAKLRGLTDADDITQRYGKFEKLTHVHWRRPNYFWQLVVRLDFSATAHFQKAQARVYLGIDKGGATPPVDNLGREHEADPSGAHSQVVTISRLEMSPSEQWRRENSASAGELKVINNELWRVDKYSGRGPCVIKGWANHPDFVYE